DDDAALDAERAAGDCDFFEQLAATRGENEIRAASGQFQRRRTADAARCSGDDDGLVFQRRGHERALISRATLRADVPAPPPSSSSHLTCLPPRIGPPETFPGS